MKILQLVESVKGVKIFWEINQFLTSKEPPESLIFEVRFIILKQLIQNWNESIQIGRRTNVWRGKSELNFLSCSLINIPIKILRKIKSYRKTIIKRLKVAKVTFTIIDEAYLKLIKTNALKYKNKLSNKERENILIAKNQHNIFNNLGRIKPLNSEIVELDEGRHLQISFYFRVSGCS